MREILFRAKRIDNGEWVEGYPVIYPSGKAEIFKECGEPPDILLQCNIDPETICQYTGLKDKNGKRIWENDILRGFTYPFLCGGKFNYFSTVEWSEEYKYFFLYTIKNPKSSVRGISEGNSELLEDFNSDDWEVIGNVLDDKELLEN